MIAYCGDFSAGKVTHDVVLPLCWLRSPASIRATLTRLLVNLFDHWTSLGKATQTMRSAIVHCIGDASGRHDCLYVTFGSQHFSYQVASANVGALVSADTRLVQRLAEEHGLTGRVLQIRDCMDQGRANPEVGGFTVENYMQRVFKILKVVNRVQAVAKFNAIVSHA